MLRNLPPLAEVTRWQYQSETKLASHPQLHRQTRGFRFTTIIGILILGQCYMGFYNFLANNQTKHENMSVDTGGCLVLAALAAIKERSASNPKSIDKTVLTSGSCSAHGCRRRNGRS